MATYRITGPDGASYQVTAPDTASEAEVLAYAQQNYSKPAKPLEPVSRSESVGMGLADPIHGGAQALTKLLPDGVVRAGNAVNNWLADNTGLVARLPEGGVDEQVRQREADYQQRRKASGDSGLDWWRVVGNVVNPANVALASRLPQAATLTGRMAAGALGGAATSALNPVTEGNYSDEKAKQIAFGTGFGAAVPAVTGALARFISPNASTNSAVQLLKNEGVTPTVGQALGGRWSAAEEKLMSVPILGDAISGARGRALEQFNNAAINRATAPIGQEVKGSGQEAVRKAGDLISDVYDQGKAALGAFKIDQQASAELSSLRQLARAGLEGRERATVEQYFKDYLRKPAMTAEAFKELDSKLAKDVGRYSGSSDAYQQKVGDALSEVRRIVSDNAKRANPQAAATLKKADEAWANLVRVEAASKAGMNNSGVFTPAQLNMAVRQGDSSVRDRATARGTALMQDLSNAGQSVLGNRVPNSGTTDRLLLNLGSLGGGAYLDPTIPLGLLAAGSLYTRPLQGLLSGAVTARPQLAQPVAQTLRQASPALVPLGAQVGLGLLN